MRRTGPAVAGNVTVGMISSTQCRSWAGSGVIVWSTKYSTPASTRAWSEAIDLVRRPEQVDRLEVVLAALGAHHLEEGAMLLLARLDRVVGQDEVQEVLVGDEAVARIAAVLAVVGLQLAPVPGDLMRRTGRSRDPAIRAQRAP